MQKRAVADPKRFVINESITLREYSLIYSEEEAVSWIALQYTPIFKFSDIGNSADSDAMIGELSEMTYGLFINQKCSVFILFCGKLRSGQYGKTFGTLKIDAVLDAANKFLRNDLPNIIEECGAEMQKELPHEDYSQAYRRYTEGYGNLTEEEAIKYTLMAMGMTTDELTMHRCSNIMLGKTTMLMRKVMVELEKMDVLIRHADDAEQRVYLNEKHWLVRRLIENAP